MMGRLLERIVVAGREPYEPTSEDRSIVIMRLSAQIERKTPSPSYSEMPQTHLSGEGS
ncbi:MAG: hypothetical protein ABSF50_12120 [Burkholderiaceae bacterium]|jgi:hypothetical protein